MSLRSASTACSRTGAQARGVAVGVWQGETTYTTGQGRVADDRRYVPDERTIFEIGSITKVFTANACSRTWRGTGSLLSTTPCRSSSPTASCVPSAGRAITLADLASHTSGLPRLPKGFLRRALRERGNPYASFTVDELDRAIAATKPRRAPGREGPVLELRCRAPRSRARAPRRHELEGARRRARHATPRDGRHRHRRAGCELPASPRATVAAAARFRIGKSLHLPALVRFVRPSRTSSSSSTPSSGTRPRAWPTR